MEKPLGELQEMKGEKSKKIRKRWKEPLGKNYKRLRRKRDEKEDINLYGLPAPSIL